MLVCPAVFKTVAGGEELPRWVRFPHTLAIKKPRLSGLFACFGIMVTEKYCGQKARYFGIFETCCKTISLLISLFGAKFFVRFASSPAGEPFGIVQAPPKSCPRLRGKCRGASRDERGTARRCQAVLAFPLSLTSFDSSPAGGGAFWCSINSKPKASLSREVDFAKQKTEGVCLP